MSAITCAISGVTIELPIFSKLVIPHTAGYIHPIFAASNKQLESLYIQHTKDLLSVKESYLLFLALLHATDKIIWETPVSLNPNSKATAKLVESSISILIEVVHKTNAINSKQFKQPKYTVRTDNCNLHGIRTYLRAWQDNLINFSKVAKSSLYEEKVKKLENKLTHMIHSYADTSTYTKTVASWADKAAGFPTAKASEWRKIIENCFDESRMRSTSLTAIQEVKEYCECNVEVGSLHYFKLMEVLKAGIVKHTNYLGDYSLTPISSIVGKSYLDSVENTIGDEAKNKKAVTAIIASAPTAPPQEKDYPTKMAFIKAKLAYRIASNKASQSGTQSGTGTDTSSNSNSSSKDNKDNSSKESSDRLAKIREASNKIKGRNYSLAAWDDILPNDVSNKDDIISLDSLDDEDELFEGAYYDLDD